MKATILLFHRVNPLRDKLWDPMPPELFEKIIHFVNKNYDVCSLDDVLNSTSTSTDKKLAISFDDGYKDFIEHALPVLKQYKMPSSMFVVTDCVDKGLPPWTYLMDFAFDNTAKLTIQPAAYGKQSAAFEIFEWPDKKAQLRYCQTFKAFLKNVPNEERTSIVHHFLQEFNDVTIPTDLMMTWDDLKMISNDSVQVGSHTCTHPPLATMDSEADLMNELRTSGDIIQQRLGFFPSTISYPVGSYNTKVKAVAKEAGYKFGLAVNQSLYDSDKHDLFEVPRIELYNESFLRSKLKMRGIESAIKSVFKL